MDKRYLIMIIIICACCMNLYMIANFSDVVGTASVNVGNYSFSLPEGFSLYDDGHTEVYIHNPSSKMNIQFYAYLGENDTFLNKYKEINSSKEYKILSNGSIEDNGITIESVFYQKTDDMNNRSTFYFTKNNHNFRILINGFNYDTGKNEVIKIVTDIVESIRINHGKTG